LVPEKGISRGWQGLRLVTKKESVEDCRGFVWSQIGLVEDSRGSGWSKEKELVEDSRCFGWSQNRN
jgi:hypothetical protein